MRNRRRASITLTTIAVLTPLVAGGQAPPRTPWGDPDLQGIWTGSTLTPLERPGDLAGKTYLTAEEAAEQERRADQRRFVERAPRDGDPGTYNQIWFDPGTRIVPDRRTALIVDPPDGRVPGARPGVSRQATEDGESKRPVRFRVGGIGSDGPEDRGLAERCLLGFNSGPPIVPAGYNRTFRSSRRRTTSSSSTRWCTTRG